MKIIKQKTDCKEVLRERLTVKPIIKGMFRNVLISESTIITQQQAEGESKQ